MRGKRTSQEKREELLALYAAGKTIQEIAQLARTPENTVRDLVIKGIPQDELVKLRTQQKERYINRAWGLIHQMVGEMERKMPNASFKDIAIGFGIQMEKLLLAQGHAMPGTLVQVNQDNRSVTIVDTSGWSVEDKKRFLADPNYRPSQRKEVTSDDSTLPAT